MGAQEEILQQFFSSLEQANTLPAPTIDRLKQLWEEGKLGSKDELLDAIARGVPHAAENQGD